MQDEQDVAANQNTNDQSETKQKMADKKAVQHTIAQLSKSKRRRANQNEARQCNTEQTIEVEQSAAKSTE